MGKGKSKGFRICFILFPFLLLLFMLPRTICDLNSDINALLSFASSVPHSRLLNWNISANPICTSWIGITCNIEGTRVASLRLPAVGLYGQIPSNTIGRLDALSVISLRSNRLYGKLPNDILSLPFLRNAYFQKNNLSGNIPTSLSTNLNMLDLSVNSFTGTIPSEVQNLTGLSGLMLQNNSLSGVVPDFNTTRLKHLNLSYNNLHGRIPFSLHNFTESSFKGNDMLCRGPLSKCSFSPSPTRLPEVNRKRKRPHKRFSKMAIIVASIVGFAVAFVLIVVVVLCCLRKKERGGNLSVVKGKVEKPKHDFGSGVQEAEKNKLVFFEGSVYNFDLEDLLRASAEVLGKGSYGTAYKAVLEEGVTVVVKRLKDVVVGKKEFEQQMEIIGSVVEHPNVVPLRAYYYSKDEKLLVYDYIIMGSLSALLHGNRDTRPLNWESRLNITIGAAKGIAHLHAVGGLNSKFTHGNLKSSNILLTHDLTARVSDFGLTPMMNHHSLPSRTAGYRAPEAIESQKTTQKSDVYSFGVILLEMLTGKLPATSPGRDDVTDLPRWVQSVVREEWTAEVFDVELLKDRNVEEELVLMLQIAMTCVSKVPDDRPTMEHVVKMIEEIRSSGSENRPSSEEN